MNLIANVTVTKWRYKWWYEPIFKRCVCERVCERENGNRVSKTDV